MLSLSRKAFSGYKKQIILISILGFLSGLLEAVGVNVIIPIFSFIGNNNQVEENIISRIIKEFFIFFHIDFSLKYLFAFICFLFIFKSIFVFVSDYVRIKIVADYEEIIRKKLLKKTFKASWPYLLNQKLGHLENILSLNVRHSAVFLQQISTIIILFSGLLMYILVAINISLIITLITIFLGFLIFLIFKPLMSKTRLASYQEENNFKNISHFVNESVLGIKTIKALSVGEEIINKGEEYFKNLKDSRIKIFLYGSISSSLLQPISLIFICLLFAFSYKLTNFNVAVFLATIYLVQRIFQYIQQIQTTLHKINNNFPYLKNVLSYMDTVDKNQEIMDNCSKNKSFKFENSIIFKNVNFSYEIDKEVISNINFSINKGEIIGLIGSSGSGKTTIVDLMLRLFKIDKGEILLDGESIYNIDFNEWRNNIGYVSQDIYLMNDTIENNIKFYKDLNEKDLIEVAKQANILDFINKSKKGFKTIIGERGVILSAGQRQRIVIARILARKTKVLILDEATSALDNESELKIQEVIKKLKGKITIFIIAHRLSTVMDCDRIIAIDNGSIIEQGSPKELLKDKNTYFYKMNNIKK